MEQTEVSLFHSENTSQDSHSFKTLLRYILDSEILESNTDGTDSLSHLPIGKNGETNLYYES